MKLAKIYKELKQPQKKYNSLGKNRIASAFLELVPKKRVIIPASLRNSKLLWATAATLPICIFFYQYLSSGSKLIGGDFDYFAQLYEAFRLSVIHYHQLPLWNPWMSGGVPLYANPQFGLISLQSLLVLPFGAIYGLKLSYVLYAIAGFWGMYMLTHRVVGSSRVRSLLVSYIWVFSGFFAGHNISHYTFSLFFLTPWLFYFLARRSNKWSWLWFGGIESIILLSSIHYAFLMTSLVVGLYFCLSLLRINRARGRLSLKLQLTRNDIMYVLKVLAVIIILAGYRFLATYYYIAHNPKIPALLIDSPNHPILLIKSLFLPIATHLPVPPNLQWGWAEYSMYLGLSSAIALLFCIGLLLRQTILKQKIAKFSNPHFVITILIIGFVTFLLAIGDVNRVAPFHILRQLPGFSETRVAARWLYFTMFSILILLAAWPRQKRLINLLLALSVLELFISFGPPKVTGADEIAVPKAAWSSTFSQYDNGRKHLDATALNIMHFYYYTTAKNIGQVYSDDSVVDTLDGVVNTKRCGLNTSTACSFVQTDNARVAYWSPNKIIIERTAPGPIELNMNVDRGWQVNDAYPFAGFNTVNPVNRFVLGDNGQKIFTLKYAPKFSPSWLIWRVERL